MKLLGEKCTIDHYGAVLSKVLQHMQQGDTRIDLQGVERFDSSCIALILACRRRYPELVICNIPERLERLIKLYGVQEIILPTLVSSGT